MDMLQQLASASISLHLLASACIDQPTRYSAVRKPSSNAISIRHMNCVSSLRFMPRTIRSSDLSAEQRWYYDCSANHVVIYKYSLHCDDPRYAIIRAKR
jgi:hypothetical protein